MHRWRAYLIFLALFAAALFAMHGPLLDLPYHWDEIGFYVPASLDIYHGGHWVPVSTQPTVHPPLVMAYLAGVWTMAGYSITATRVAMLVLASLGVLAVFVLGIRLGRETEGIPALIAVVFLLASPLFYTQAMMAQLDMPAMVLTAVTLWLFLEGRYRAAAGAAVALVLVKETAIVVPAVLGCWLAWERKREALWFLAPLAALVAWMICLASTTGNWLGSAGFADYNLSYPLQPARMASALLRRIHALGFANFRWIGLMAMVAGRRALRGRDWRIVGAIVAAQVVEVSALGGARLERYLLPVLPLFYIAAAVAFTQVRRGWRIAGQGLMICGLLAGMWWNSPYPAPLENNLAMTTFIGLHQTVAEFLEADYPNVMVTTAWPLSDALQRPEYGYVRRGMRVHRMRDFRRVDVERLKDVEVLVLYSLEWRGGPFFGPLWEKYIEAPGRVSSEECQERFGLREVARWRSRGQWIAVLASDSERRPVPGRTVGWRGAEK